MMAEARFQPVKQIPAWMKATFNADNVEYPLMLRTRSPGQRLLVFTLDGTRYSKFAFIPMTAIPEPAKYARAGAYQPNGARDAGAECSVSSERSPRRTRALTRRIDSHLRPSCGRHTICQ
jgi:hypothetical protein